MEYRYYKETAKRRWFQFSILEQMGNIGSDVGRAIKYRERGDFESTRRAFDCALELFELTLSDPRWSNMHRLKEIRMARELVCDFFLGENQYNETGESLMKYFDEFALAVRKDR